MRPETALMMCANACSVRHGPDWPKREIERHAALAHVDAHEVRRLILAPGLELDVAAARVVALAPLDLDDVGAEVGEQARAVRAREHAREVEDPEAGERSGRIGHGRLVYTRCRRDLAAARSRKRARTSGSASRPSSSIGRSGKRARSAVANTPAPAPP